MKLFTLIRKTSPIPASPLRRSTNAGDKDIRCKFCNYSALYEQGVRNHRRMKHTEQTNDSDWETDSENIECNECDKGFDTAADLKHHFLSTKWMCLFHSRCLISRNVKCGIEDCLNSIVEK